MAFRLAAGQTFPDVTVARLGGGDLTLGRAGDGRDWRMIVVYRGKHCPICKRYLAKLQEVVPDLHGLGVDVVAVSADPEDKAAPFIAEIGVEVPVGYDLSVDQMRTLGLYISDPRSPEETDRPFSEPGLFVVNRDGVLQLADISNAPFARPDLDQLAGGLKFIREKNYPIRGTHAD